MSLTIKLTSDIARCTGSTEFSVDAANYSEALWKLVAAFPACRDLLVNSKGELRDTVRCSAAGKILNEESTIGDAPVELFFIRSGG
jgi:hypothetical protein